LDATEKLVPSRFVKPPAERQYLLLGSKIDGADAHLRKVFSGAANHLHKAVTDAAVWQRDEARSS
jgi:hypothetical protein